jgi:hypothetical protein
MTGDTLEAMSRTLLLARQLISGTDVDLPAVSRAFQRTTVALVADEANLACAAGQHALVTLFNLVARQGCGVRLIMPAVPQLGVQPPLSRAELQSGLLDLGADLIPGATVTPEPGPADLAFVLGDTPWKGEAELAWRLGAGAWTGWTELVTNPGMRFRGDWPMGALAAAALVGAEPFKAALRRADREGIVQTNRRFVRPSQPTRFLLAPDGTGTEGADLGDVDIISGGAITNALLYTLLRLPGLCGTVRVFEPDTIALSNLNRYLLVRASNLDALKTTVLSGFSTPLLSIDGIPERFTEESRQYRRLAPYVLVGVDHIPSRWTVQECWPQWLGVGATEGVGTVTSSHTPGQACAGCAHPVDVQAPGDVPTASFVSFWAGLLLAVRLVRHHLGCPHPSGEQRIDFSTLLPDGECARMVSAVRGREDCPVSCGVHTATESCVSTGRN